MTSFGFHISAVPKTLFHSEHCEQRDSNGMIVLLSRTAAPIKTTTQNVRVQGKQQMGEKGDAESVKICTADPHVTTPDFPG